MFSVAGANIAGLTFRAKKNICRTAAEPLASRRIFADEAVGADVGWRRVERGDEMKVTCCALAAMTVLGAATTPADALRASPAEAARARHVAAAPARAAQGGDPRSPYRFFGYYGPEDAVTLESVLFPERPRRGVVREGSQ